MGVVLAKKLNMRFLDSDLVIQEEYGKTLEELIEEHGDAGFIRIEDEVNYNLNPHNTIIATGGSAVYGQEAMEHFKNIGKIIFLDVPECEREERIGNLAERGVVSNGKTSIEEIFADRLSLYRKYADITVCENKKLLRESVEELYRLVKSE